MVQEYIKSEIATLRLPVDFAETVKRWYQPVAEDVASRRARSSTPLVIGVQGVQGSGKSTLARFLQLILQNEHALRAAVLSLDDFYLTHRERFELAETIHPLLITRGVPGTHDVHLAREIIGILRKLGPGQQVAIPRFNKAIDDREPASNWDSISGPVDIIIFEGWCVGADAQPADALRQPANTLEAEADSDGVWRKYVNDQLKQEYATLFSYLDKLAVLSAPSFNCVFRWRLLQEQKLKEKWEQEQPNQPCKIQTPEQLRRFISHYERISRHCLATLPAKADWLLALDENHRIVRLTKKTPARKNTPTFFLVATDLDGTLLDHRTYSHAAAAPAIDALKSKNIPIIFNTSKTRSEVLTIQKTMAIAAPYIVENGSAVYLPKTLFDNPLDDASDDGEDWQKILGKEHSFIIEQIHKLRNKYDWHFEGFFDWTIEQVMHHTGLDQQAATAALNRQFSEPIIWRDSDSNFSAFVSALKEHQLTTIRGGRFIHITGNCDKGRALTWLATQYQTLAGHKPKLIALGDSQNDIDMLSVADYAVAVKSPVHPFPDFKSKGKKLLTSLCGPEGWNSAVLDIINHQCPSEEK